MWCGIGVGDGDVRGYVFSTEAVVGVCGGFRGGGRWGGDEFVLFEGFFDCDALVFGFALGFFVFDGFVVGEVLEVFWVGVGLVGLGVGRGVVLF